MLVAGVLAIPMGKQIWLKTSDPITIPFNSNTNSRLVVDSLPAAASLVDLLDGFGTHLGLTKSEEESPSTMNLVSSSPLKLVSEPHRLVLQP